MLKAIQLSHQNYQDVVYITCIQYEIMFPRLACYKAQSDKRVHQS